MGIRWLKMGKMSDKITQDGGKMRKMRDVSSGLAPLGGVDTAGHCNNGAGPGPGEVPPLGWVTPPLRQPQNPYSDSSA